MHLDILGAGAAQGLAGRVAGEAGVALDGAFGAEDVIQERFLAGEACDLVILNHAQVASLTAQRKVDPAYCADLGVVAVSLRTHSDDMTAMRAVATVYTAAIAATSPRAADARAFADRMTGAPSAALRAASGFEGIVIRRARPGDEAACQAVVHGVLPEYGLKPEPQGTDADLADLDAHYFSQGGSFDVAVAPDGAIVGCCGVRPQADGSAELRKMYLRREARGEGVGRRLLERAVAFARARRFPRLELETASALNEAIALYRKAGFVERPGTPATRRCDMAFVLELGV